jgi:hypothetical protein
VTVPPAGRRSKGKRASAAAAYRVVASVSPFDDETTEMDEARPHGVRFRGALWVDG